MLLKDLFVFLPKSKRSASYGKPEGKYPFFTSSNTIDKYVDEPDYNGSYLIIGDGGTGNCKYYDGEFSASDHNYIMFPKKGTNPRCVQYFLAKDNFQVLNEGFKGIGIKNVSKAYIENIDYRHNQKFSEDYICQTLGKIEELINKEMSVLTFLDELTKSRFNEMFVNHNYFKTSIRSLVEITKVSAKKRYSGTDKFEYIDISSIDNSSHEVISSTTYTISNAPSRAQQCLKTNDILVSTVRPNLKNIALFRGNNDGFVGSSGFCVLRANNCNPAYLLYNVLTDEFTGSMVRLTTGASYPAVRDDDVLDYQIYDAPIHLQNKFANFVEQVDKLKFNVQQRIEKYKELLDKKMSEYFN